MPTTVRAGTSSSLGIASQGGGFRSSVSTSIKSSPVRMISIGPEGGKARVDTSFGSPFARMRPSNPNLNPGGKIFGENGPSKSRTAESVYGPKLGEIRFNKPAGSVKFAPEAAAKADVDLAFAKAQAKNQAQVAERKSQDVKAVKAFITSVLPNVRIPYPNRAIDFRGFQTIPQVKEPIQITDSALISLSRGERVGVRETSTNRNDLIKPALDEAVKKATITQVRVPLAELKPAFAFTRYQNINRLVALNRPAIGLTEAFKMPPGFPEASPISQVEALLNPIPEFMPKTDRRVAASETKSVFVDQGNTFEQVTKVTQRQKDILTALAPLLKEGQQAVKDQIYQTVGIPENTARVVIENQSQINEKKVPAQETEIAQTPLQQAATVVRFIEKPSPGRAEGGQIDQEKNKAQNLVNTIKQTVQLVSLGLSDDELNQLVERQLETLEGDNKKKLALKIITEVKLTQRQTSLLETNRSELQRDPEATKARVKAGTKAVDQAETNDLGEVSASSAAEILIESYKRPVLSAVAILADRTTDGSYDRIILAVKKSSRWLKGTALAQVIDQAMEDNPAVVEVEKRLDKAVTEEDKEKVLDRSLGQLINSLLMPIPFEDKVKAGVPSRLSH